MPSRPAADLHARLVLKELLGDLAVFAVVVPPLTSGICTRCSASRMRSRSMPHSRPIIAAARRDRALANPQLEE